VQFVGLSGFVWFFESKIFQYPELYIPLYIREPFLEFKLIAAWQSAGPTFCLACRPIVTLSWLDATPSPSCPVWHARTQKGRYCQYFSFLSENTHSRKESFGLLYLCP